MKPTKVGPWRLLFSSLLSSLVLFGAACSSGDEEELAPSPTPEPLVILDEAAEKQTITVGDETFDVEVAFTPEATERGLAGRDSLADMASMLFVFESGEPPDFWMKGMRFPIDFIWISDQCTVVDTHPNAPIPPANVDDSHLPVFWSINPARYTLEINAGKIAELGIKVGDRVTFNGFSGRGAVC